MSLLRDQPAVARAETFADLSQFRGRTIATVEQDRRQAKRGVVEFPAFDSKQEIGLRGSPEIVSSPMRFRSS